jgi:probable phosphoglycerate mutase
MALFYFLRHGETAWNTEGRLCGRTDVPLSDAGRQQARLLAQRLKSIPVEALYSSPLGRTLETARLIGMTTGREPVVDDRLSELNYGVWEGQTLEEVKNADPLTYRAWDADPGRMAPPEGESGKQLIRRVVPFLDHIASRHNHGHVVVVSHKTVCRLVVCHILGVPLAEYRRRLAMENAALNILQPWEGCWRLVLFNDTSHLSIPHADSAPLGEEF